jgi:hypothetical protein
MPWRRIMRIGRKIIVPAILALGASGAILASSATPVLAAQAPTVHVVAASPYTYYHN